jgi:hypothetical protein
VEHDTIVVDKGVAFMALRDALGINGVVEG